MRSSWLYFATRSERAGAPVLIWPGAERDGEVGDRRVLRLARAVRHDRRVAGALREPHRLDRLGQRADLVHLDEDRVADAAVDALLQALRVRHEEVVADELDAVAELAASARATTPSRPRPRRPRSRRSDSGRRSPPRTPASRRSTSRGPRSGRRRRRTPRSSPGRARSRCGRDGRRARPPRGSPRSPPRSTRGRARSRPRRRRRSRARARCSTFFSEW